MAARKKRKAAEKTRGRHEIRPRSLARALVEALIEADTLIEGKRWREAADRLEALARRYPSEPEVYSRLAMASLECGDTLRYEHAAQRLAEMQPGEPTIVATLAGAYMVNLRPALAVRTFRQVLERWPEHSIIPEVREQLESLEPALEEALGQMGLSGAAGIEVAVRHEMVHALMAHGRYDEARRAAMELVRDAPDFLPAINNLSLAEAAAGFVESAVGSAKRVLDREPENVHALSNLIHYLCLSGRFDEAQEWVAPLTAAPARVPDAWLKKVEALSYLGDDAGVLQAFGSAQRAGPLHRMTGGALLCHLAAVAALRQGDEKRARRYWSQAEKLDPSLALARENLEDLRKRIGERHGPWPFAFPNWIPAATFRDITERLGRLIGRAGGPDQEEALSRAIRRVARDHPEVLRIVPALLDRGDPVGRTFASLLATSARQPELSAALRDFALGQRGPDEMRHQAARAASDAGLLAPGPVRLWLGGEWREVYLFSFEVYEEPIERHGREVQRLAERATEALRDGRAVEAEQILNEALEVEPDQPDLLNNLAVAYQLQGRTDDYEQMVRRIFAEHPDYLFGRIAVAMLAVERGDLEEARAFLQPLFERRKFHLSEFAAFAQAEMQLLIAEDHEEGALSWFKMWEDLDPDDPQLEKWRPRVELIPLLAEMKKITSAVSRPQRRSRRQRPADRT